MSIRIDITSEDSTIRWADDVDEMDSSISSEEESSVNGTHEISRPKEIQEIWYMQTVKDDLMNLPDAEIISELITNQNDNKETLFQKDKRTILLLATWFGKSNVLKELLNNISSHAEDDEGRTPLHLAALTGDVECLKILLENQANVYAWDKKRKATPLHCAASIGNLSCLKLLIGYGADVNAGINNRSPLHYAVESRAVECVKELLENGAVPNTPQVFSEAPLHIASSLGSVEIIQLLIDYGAAVNVQRGPEKVTPLHLTSEDGDAGCTKLLLEAGASVQAHNSKNQIPLHLAALSQNAETLELLINKGSDVNAKDIDGRSPLHCSIVKLSRTCECVKLLVNSGAYVNSKDNFGYTPLHLAALNEFSHCVMHLINAGGDVTARTNGGISVLNFITRKTPDVIPKYVAKFDSAIKLNDHEIGDVDCELKLDFRVLVPTMGNKETELLLNFIEVGHKEILKHPLCETFLFLKWHKRIRKYFLFSLFYHSVFVLLFTMYIIRVFLKQNPCETSDCVKIVAYMLLFLNFMLLGKELFQIAHSYTTYIKHWENWLQWSIIISVFCCVQPVPNMYMEIKDNSWIHHTAAIGIFLTWVELMMIVGRFPIFGLYIQMFTTVSYNFAKFVLGFFCLFIAFALSFWILLPTYPAFKDLRWVLIKVIIMMSGELEFDDVFFGDYEIIFHGTAHLLYLCFVLLITIILSNLMVGLAVSDIQGLQQSAGLDRLVRQVELVAHLESILFSKLLKFIPSKFMNILQKQALLLKSQYHWALYIRPNDPREARIPKNLIKSIYQIVADKKEKQPRSKKKFKRSLNSDVTPSISRLNSETTNTNNKTTPNYSRLNSQTTNFDNKNNLKCHIEEMNKEFQEFSKMFKLKMDLLSNQINVNTNNMAG